MQCTRYGPAISSYLREFSPDFSFRLFVAGQAFADISDMFPHPFLCFHNQLELCPLEIGFPVLQNLEADHCKYYDEMNLSVVHLHFFSKVLSQPDYVVSIRLSMLSLKFKIIIFM